MNAPAPVLQKKFFPKHVAIGLGISLVCALVLILEFFVLHYVHVVGTIVCGLGIPGGLVWIALFSYGDACALCSDSLEHGSFVVPPPAADALAQAVQARNLGGFMQLLNSTPVIQSGANVAFGGCARCSGTIKLSVGSVDDAVFVGDEVKALLPQLRAREPKDD